MTCGLRRCSGTRGCICPKSSHTGPVFAGVAQTHSACSEYVAAIPEDVVKLFGYFDLDGDGKLDRSELANVLQELDAPYWTMKRVRQLFRAADLDHDQFISWHEFLKWVLLGGEEQQALRAALPALEGIRPTLEARLIEADTVDIMTTALKRAKPFFAAAELLNHQQRLEAMELLERFVQVTVVSPLSGETLLGPAKVSSTTMLKEIIDSLNPPRPYHVWQLIGLEDDDCVYDLLRTIKSICTGDSREVQLQVLARKAGSKGWRVRAQTTNSTWAWDVKTLVFNTDAGVQLGKDGTSCKVMHSGSVSDPEHGGIGGYAPENAFWRGSGWWGGRRGGDDNSFFIGLQCQNPANVTSVQLAQGDTHYATELSIECLNDTEEKWQVVHSCELQPRAWELETIEIPEHALFDALS